MKLLAWGDGLIEIILRLQEQGLHLKDEVAVLKGEKKRPKFKPSRMHEEAGKAGAPDRQQQAKPGRRRGKPSRSKTAQLKIDGDEIIQPTGLIPPGSRFKGYRDFVVQDLVIGSRNTRYRLARWQTPDGETLTGQLPRAVAGSHFGATLVRRELQGRFDAVFSQKTRYATLNRLLRRIHLNKSELLLVLERPEVPLHTNDSERDIRDHVKKQKISGGTRSELGRQCRDTFSSLKKTCRKLGISFWNYLTDRISCSDHIPPLPHLVEQRLLRSA